MSQKISEKLAALGADQGFISLEFFPPKTDCGMKNLLGRIERMSVLNPLFVSITWGAGGATADRSLELAGYCQRELDLTVCLHLTCTNTNCTIIDSALARAKEAGIRNILALRGDPPRAEVLKDEEFKQGGEDDDQGYQFNYAVDLVRYIRQTHGDYFAIGVAAYPDGHVDGSDNLNQNYEHDIPFLVEKVEAGADFILTQLFFDVSQYLKFEATVLAHPSLQKVPVVPGLIPINNYQLFQRVSKLSHASIPKTVLSRFPFSAQADDRKVKEIGVQVLSEIIEELDARSQSKVKGVHFYSLNLESSIAKLVSRSPVLQKFTNFELVTPPPSAGEPAAKAASKLTGGKTASATRAVAAATNDKSLSDDSKALSPSPIVTENKPIFDDLDGNSQQQKQLRKLRSATSAVGHLSKKDILAISTGAGTLGKEATWDEFPNGRFGDSRSPAYGEIDGYGPSLKVPVGVKDPVSELWGTPQTLDDIANLFIDYLSKRIPALPFSDLEISSETLLIQEELFEINMKHWFSLSSQPALNGCDSRDSVFGWGSRNGFLYQKAYVELLISSHDWETVLKPLINRFNQSNGYVGNGGAEPLNNEISYYASKAASKNGELETNICSHNRATAVTWGVFPNKEIVQPTIIEEQSFKAWKDEAFKILLEWSDLYLVKWKNSSAAGNKEEAETHRKSYDLVKGIHDDRYLVTVFDNNFHDEDGLWNLLLS